MDISTITDIKELKALAYDQTRLLENTRNNLQLLQTRISELENTIPSETSDDQLD